VEKALFTLKSPAPEENSSAVPPLTKMPMAATATIMPPVTCTGWLMRQIASQAVPPVTTNRMIAFASAARTELLRSP
jgi:hypothetical protein